MRVKNKDFFGTLLVKNLCYGVREEVLNEFSCCFKRLPDRNGDYMDLVYISTSRAGLSSGEKDRAMGQKVRVCNVPGCPNIATDKGRCSRHLIPAWGGRRNFEGYQGDWLKIRAQVLKEEPYCRVCGQQSTTVDHITPKAEGGTDIRGNLRALCDDCRSIKDKEDSARGRRRG